MSVRIKRKLSEDTVLITNSLVALWNVYPQYEIFCIYEAYNQKKFTHSIILQPPVADQAFMAHMKAMYVPFHMGYGSLISYQRL